MDTQGWEMDRMDNHKYPVPAANNQPGLEVGDDPYRTPHSGWPDSSHPVWGADPAKYGPKSTEEFLHNQPNEPTRHAPSPRRILGVSVGMFWGLLVLLACILSGGIGGGIGAGLASQKNSCSSTQTTNTANSTVTSGSNSGPSPAPKSLCSTQKDWNGTIITPHDATGSPIHLSNDAQQFKVLCSTNFPAGPAYDTHNIMKIWTTDLTACISQCAEYNAGLETLIFNGIASSDGGQVGFCRAVSLELLEGDFCYLKNGTGTGGDTSSASKQVASAVLVTNTPS